MKFVEIKHSERKGNRSYSVYLGDVQVDIPHTTRFYCKATNEIIQVTIGENQEIKKTVIKSKERVSCLDSIAIMGKNGKK